jgi:RimJ/RimL family protein N-acetyltransferase
VPANDKDGNFMFKRVEEKDLPLLYSWFQASHVKQWWPVPEKKEDFFNSFLKRIRSTEIVPYIVLLNDKPIGYLQSYPVDRSKSTWLPDLPDGTIGIDQFIGEREYVGKGFGTLFIKDFIHFLQNKNNHFTVIVDPDPNNLAAIRCYEKVGFMKVGEYQAPLGPALIMRFD